MKFHTAVSTLLAIAPLCSPAADSAVVFMYHHVATDTPAVTSVTPGKFVEQLDYLQREGFSVLPLPDVVTALRNGEDIPAKSVVLTFDDGYESVLTNAMPELKRRGMPFTVFVTPEYAGGGYGGYLEWDGLRELVAAGATIGNHSATHTHFVRRDDGETRAAWRERIAGEIDEADSRLRSELGSAVIPVLAYPFGEYDDEIRALVSERDIVAFGQHSGAVGPRTDWTAAPRYPVATGYDDLAEFALRSRTRELQLDVVSQTTIVGADRRPALEAVVIDTDVRTADLACYASGQGRMDIEWPDDARRFIARPRAPLATGRVKYNCTAPSATANGVYHWFGQVLLVPYPDGRWYEE